ncbi:4a-hydroxytetrahydrobiopterin dehydratase [Edaphobacter flagellatus]|uniref:4a-hydroxytetrahydrobiopterin dehydratase n=1 Tax=Edaphobacter flagellatus TaxID=1933044 RepID=UPI0021B28A21|nr:4a-hydroxytetrahydrobiopterin dehydratase [Edaphobacter flagellatus]
MATLSSSEIDIFLKTAPAWKLDSGKLVRDWEFADFVHAMAFVNRVAELAEAVGHHPDIDIRYNKVRLGLIPRLGRNYPTRYQNVCPDRSRT